MKNNLPAKYKNSLLNKISNFFKKIFGKKNVHNIEIRTEVEEIDNFKKNIRVDGSIDSSYIQNMNKEQFIEQFEKQPNLLYNLSVEQLEKLDIYYDEILEVYRQKLRKIG